MRIAGVYSFNNGKEIITRQHRAELEEVLQVIEAVDAEQSKTKVSREKTMRDKVLYSPPSLNEAFKALFYGLQRLCQNDYFCQTRCYRLWRRDSTGQILRRRNVHWCLLF